MKGWFPTLKAIILCGEGEEGLAPLTLERPLPLLSLFDKPLLAHQAGLLRRHGVREIGVALPRLSRMVEDAMGDGEELGVRFTWLPCRGAGELELLAACAGFLGEEDALVLPGGGLAHRPPAAGRALVFSDGEGRVERLLDAPAGRLLASQVETGVCILTAAARAGAAGEGTLAGRLSALLDRGEALYGVVPEGQWRELTGGEAYLDALADALSGKLRLRWDAPRTAPGVWSASPLPPSVQVVPPCYIGPGVQVGEGSLLGPRTVREGGSTVGRRALVQRSALLGAAAEERVAVWPGRRVPAGARLTASLTAGGLKPPLAFGGGGTLEGAIGTELTAETLLVLGGLLGREGTVGLGWAGGAGARMLAQAAGSGAAAAGGRVLSHDASCPSAAAWLAESWGLPVSLFVQQEGERARLYFFDRRGMPLGRARERRLEGALLRSELRRMPAGRVGQWESVTGVRPAYAADAAKRSQVTQAPLRRLEVAVPGREPADGALAEALERLGCTVRREAFPGVPAFRTGRGGFRLLAEDEEGEPLPPEQLLTIVALIEYEDGAGRVAVPDAAPAAIDTLAAGYHGGALRLGRDGPEAEARYGELPWLRDALFAACRICAHLGMTGERLHGLAGKIPRFVLRRREVSLRSGQGEVLSVLLRTLPGAQPAGGGLRLRQGEGWVTLVPLARSAVLRIVGEARSAELAEELCAFCARRAEEADRGLPEK